MKAALPVGKAKELRHHLHAQRVREAFTARMVVRRNRHYAKCVYPYRDGALRSGPRYVETKVEIPIGRNANLPHPGGLSWSGLGVPAGLA